MNNQVKEIVFTGPDGKLVGKYKKGQSLNPPIALLIHPHPLYGGTMNNPIVMELFSIFDSLGFLKTFEDGTIPIGLKFSSTM